MTLPRSVLFELASHSDVQFGKSATKTVLAEVVEDNWRNITNAYANDCPTAVGSIFADRQAVAPNADNEGGSVNESDDDDADNDGGSVNESDDSDVPSEGGGSADVQPPKSLEEHAFKDDEGNSTDVLKLGDANGRFAVEVIVPKKHGETRVIYSYNNSTTGIDLIHDLSEAVGATIDPRMCSIKCGASHIELFESLHGYAYNAESIRLEIRVKGGALVRRGFVKKEDRINMLIKKSKAYVSKKIEEKADVVGTAPMTLQTFIAPMEQKMATFKQKLLAKEVSLKDLMDGLEDAKLHQIIECLDVSKREHTEERLYKIAPMLIEDMMVLDASIPRLANLRIEMFELLLEAFAMDYTIEKGTELIYCPDKFLADLHAVENYRRGVRRLSEAPSEGDAVSSGSGCGIMWEVKYFQRKISFFDASSGKFYRWQRKIFT